MSRYRVSMDIGGTFTDVVAYDEERGTLRRRQVVDDAARPHGGRLAALEQVDRLACRDRLHGARHDAGAQRLPAAPRRARAAARHARRRRRLPHRPRQPPPPLRRPLPQADAARAASRHRRDRRTPRAATATSSSRSTRTPSAPRRAARATRASARSPSPSSSPTSTRPTSCARRTILREELGAITVSLSHRVAREWREYERTVVGGLDAYTAPIVRRYLERLESELQRPRPRRAAARDAVERRHRHRRVGARAPLQTLLSGPVGGTMGGVALARMPADARTSSASTWAAPASTSPGRRRAARRLLRDRRSRASRC